MLESRIARYGLWSGTEHEKGFSMTYRGILAGRHDVVSDEPSALSAQPFSTPASLSAASPPDSVPEPVTAHTAPGHIGQRRCPSCSAPMRELLLEGHHGQTILLDLCFGCHGIWFDDKESQQLSARGVLQLFETLHAHREQPHSALRTRLSCPACRLGLIRGSDRTVSGSYVAYRCPKQHGRFGTFSSFMVEKGFVRHLSAVEVSRIAQKLRVIHCSSCGAAVDLRKDHACPYCRSAFSLLDPDAVNKALQQYHEKASVAAAAAMSDGATDPMARAATVLAQRNVEYQAEKHRLQRRVESIQHNSVHMMFLDELWELGVAVVWHAIRGLWR